MFILNFLFYLILKMACQSVVFSYLWNWFVVSLLSLPEISFDHAIGIILIVEVLKGLRQSSSSKNNLMKEDFGELNRSFLFELFNLSFFFLLGWLFSFFVS